MPWIYWYDVCTIEDSSCSCEFAEDKRAMLLSMREVSLLADDVFVAG